jgi:hypothetical protein
LSDVDIAVYFYPENRNPIEYEEERIYEGENGIWADMEDLLKKTEYLSQSITHFAIHRGR